LLAVRAELEQLGLQRVDECIMLGTVSMLERCVSKWRSRNDVGLGWLASSIRQGGYSAEQPAHARRPETVAELFRGAS
jgi:hypothetical protein